MVGALLSWVEGVVPRWDALRTTDGLRLGCQGVRRPQHGRVGLRVVTRRVEYLPVVPAAKQAAVKPWAKAQVQ